MSNASDVKSKEVRVVLQGKVYTLKYDLNSFVALEEEFNAEIEEVLNKMQNGSVKALRALLWAGLIHQDESLTAKDVGKMIDLASLEDIMKKVNTAVKAALPEPAGSEQQGNAQEGN